VEAGLVRERPVGRSFGCRTQIVAEAQHFGCRGNDRRDAFFKRDKRARRPLSRLGA
jgi:hypothetical protein